MMVDYYAVNFFSLKIGQFQDDRQSSRLRTLVAHYTPVQVGLDLLIYTGCSLANL